MLTRPLLLLVIWVGLTTDLEPTVRADDKAVSTGRLTWVATTIFPHT